MSLAFREAIFLIHPCPIPWGVSNLKSIPLLPHYLGGIHSIGIHTQLHFCLLEINQGN